MRVRWFGVLVFAVLGWQVHAMVVDEAGLLDSNQAASLTATTGTTVGIHIASSTHGLPLRRYSDEWALSQKAAQPQLEVVITVVPSSHQLYISIGHSARPHFSTADADQVINTILVPAFRSGNWEGGLTQAVHAIGAHLGSLSVAGTTLQTAPTTTIQTAPATPVNELPVRDSGLIWIVALAVIAAGIVGGISWSRWNRKFRHFESVVSAGIPDFPMNPEVKAEPEVRDALDMLRDLHGALPIDRAPRTAYYRRRKDDFNSAYETCLRAQQSYELQQRQAAAAQQRFESIRDRFDTLPPDQQARFQALQSQYTASGNNSMFLLQNMVMMDLMVNALEPHMLYSQPTIIENNYYGDDRTGGGGWQTGSDDDFDGNGGGGDGGGDSGDGGSW